MCVVRGVCVFRGVWNVGGCECLGMRGGGF